jgi:hypothetical protein
MGAVVIATGLLGVLNEGLPILPLVLLDECQDNADA